VATPGARAPEATASVRPHADTPRLLPLRETRWTQRWDPRRPLGSSGTRSRCPTTKSTSLSLPMQRSAKSPGSNCARVKERWHPSPSVSAPPLRQRDQTILLGRPCAAAQSPRGRDTATSGARPKNQVRREGGPGRRWQGAAGRCLSSRRARRCHAHSGC